MTDAPTDHQSRTLNRTDRPAHPAQDGTRSRRDPLRDLRRDIRLLEMQLRQVLHRFGSSELVERIATLRESARHRRVGEHIPQLLLDAVQTLDDEQIEALLRTLLTYFDLVNLAEDRHRIRVLRERSRAAEPGSRAESIGDAVRRLRERGFSDDGIVEQLNTLRIEPVFTAHPTEAKRKSIRATLRRIRADLIELDNPALLRSERATVLRRIRADIDCLWETESLRPNPPTVMDEVERTLDYTDTLWRVTPTLMEEARAAVGPEYRDQVRSFLRFGSWVGGDRDGNPYVTVDVTRQTLERMRGIAMQRHIGECDRLFDLLTISDRYHRVSDDLATAIQQAGRAWPVLLADIQQIHPGSRYRQFLAIIRRRLEATGEAGVGRPATDLAYSHSDELLSDVQLIKDSLRASGHEALSEEVQQWLDRIETFGLHLLTLDIRVDAKALNSAAGELAEVLGLIDNREHTSRETWRTVLTGELTEAGGTRFNQLSRERLSAKTAEMLRLFELMRIATGTFDRRSLGCLILSMTHTAEDMLAALWLGRLAAVLTGEIHPAPMPLVPLFETVGDLEAAPTIMADLFDDPDYRAHLQRTGDRQVCMIGYSDSTKDGGYLAANWSLHQAQAGLADLGQQAEITIDLFHGRGGSIGRGGGPAARAVLALPHRSIHGRMRLTEQGEVLAERYDNRDIAHRHLEQLTWATLLASNTDDQPVEARWRDVIDQAAPVGRRAYRQLIEHDGFIDYFRQATPIDQIETLPIGSRPSRRRGMTSLDDLRAIPYTFAWTQSRQIVTGFFGLGAGFGDWLSSDLELLQRMYRDWPFFRALIDNAELGLIRFEPAIAARYAALAEGAHAATIHRMIVAEYEAARHVVLSIKDESGFAASLPWLRAAFERRNPDVDLLNLVQCHLLQRSRDEGGAADMDARSHLAVCARQTIQAIASGLRTTG